MAGASKRGTWRRRKDGSPTIYFTSSNFVDAGRRGSVLSSVPVDRTNDPSHTFRTKIKFVKYYLLIILFTIYRIFQQIFNGLNLTKLDR